MSYNKKLLLSVSSGAILAMTAFAAQAAEKETNPMEEIVVTGVSSAHGERKQDAPFAITTADEQAIRDAAPLSTADIAKLVPGMFAEVTGGQSGPNIEVRGFPTSGDAPWVTVQLDGLPIFPVATLSFLDTSTQFRLDDSVARAEATIGGPAVLWGAGQPGATMNFTQKNGLDNQEGVVRFTGGSGSLERFDGYYGGKIAPDWFASLGGFYTTQKGVRDTQYPSDQGYQIEGTITHTIDQGKLQFYGRKTDTNTQFFTPIPLTVSGTGTGITIHPYPGFNPLTATFFSNANRYVTIDTGPGGQQLTMDTARGRGINTQVFGFDFEKSWKGLDFNNKLSYMSGTTYSVTQFTGANPQTLGSFITSEISTANSTVPLTSTGGAAATSGTAQFVNGQGITDLTMPVIGIGNWYVAKQLTAFQDEGRVAKQITDSNRLTAGFWFADYTSHDIWYLGNQMLMNVVNHATPISVTLNNGVKVTSPGGTYGSVGYAVNNDYSAKNIAGIIADDWQVTDKLKLAAGFRIEHEGMDATAGGLGHGFIGTSPLNLYDYGATYLNGTYSGYNHEWWAHAISASADYELQKNLNLFLSYNQGYAMPTFDDARNNGFAAYETVTHVKQLQGGIKTTNDLYTVTLDGFYSKFTGQPQGVRLASGTQVNFTLDSESEGVELAAVVKPFHNFEIEFSGDYQHGTYTAGGQGVTNNEVARQPDVQFRFTPSYKFDTSLGILKLYATTTYVDGRWGDILNTQYLPSYATEDVGASFLMDNGLDIQFTGTNITNTLAITEGNARVLGSGLSGSTFLGRPLFGAAYQLSVAYHF